MSTQSHPVPGPIGAAGTAGSAGAALPTERPPRTPAPRAHFDTVPWKRVGLFMAISYGLFALFALPFWILPEGIAHPLYTVVISAGMFTPAIASLILAKGVEKTSWRTRVGLRLRGRWKSLLLWAPLAMLIVLAIHYASAVLMVLRGVPGDLTARTWAEMTTSALSEAIGTEIGLGTAILYTVVIVGIGIAVTSVTALGEEIGWRGWLWPALKPLGTVRGAIVGGAIWSLWHLPIVLIGHNYPGEPRAAAVAMFILPCIGMTLLFGALTERAGGNPIPAAIAHGTLNASLGAVLGLVATTETMPALNPFIDTVLGVIGVALLLLAGAAVMPWKRLRHNGGGTGPTIPASPERPAAGPASQRI